MTEPAVHSHYVPMSGTGVIYLEIGTVSQDMRYFVTGATGLMGTHVVSQLVNEGHEVIALTRARSNAAHLPDEVTVVEGDVTDKRSLREPMAGVDGVFHIAGWVSIGPGPRNVETAERINVGGTRNVLELMEELDIPKGVYTSGLGVYPGTSDEIYDESYIPDRPTFAVYVRTLWEAHYEVAKPMMEDGLPLVIVLPGTVYGPIERPLQEGRPRGAFQNYLTGDLPMIPRGFTMPFEHAEDTAHNHIRAMTDGVSGEEYIIANEPRTMVEVFDLAEEITRIPAPRAVPPAVFGGLAKVMAVTERVVTPPEGLASELLAFHAGRDFAVDNTKAKRELGIKHRPLEEGLREYLPWEMDHLGLDIPEELPAAQ